MSSTAAAACVHHEYFDHLPADSVLIILLPVSDPERLVQRSACCMRFHEELVRWLEHADIQKSILGRWYSLEIEYKQVPSEI